MQIPDPKLIAQELQGKTLDIQLHLDALDANTLIGLLQLALRHPDLQNKSEVRQPAEQLGRELQTALADISPKLSSFIELGWHPEYDVTAQEFAQDLKAGNAKPLIEVHNPYCLYELNEDGSTAEQGLLEFRRPQDWGNPQRWHYHTCTIRFETNDQRIVNHCHLWQEVQRHSIEAFQAISQELFMAFMPGQPRELCDRSHLHLDDFWSDDWGNIPPHYEADEEFMFL